MKVEPKHLAVYNDSEVIMVEKDLFYEWCKGVAPVYRRHTQSYTYEEYINDQEDGVEVLIVNKPYDLEWHGDVPCQELKNCILSNEKEYHPGFSYWYYAIVRLGNGKGYPLPLLFGKEAINDIGPEETERLRKVVMDWAQSPLA